MRIVSLVPSQTELLFSLGLGNEVVGVTGFCRHPLYITEGKVSVGGTKDFDIEKIISLHPDLVLANKEENEKSHIEKLQKSLPVWLSNVDHLTSALQMIREVGKITNRVAEANNISTSIESSFQNLSCKRAIRTAYFIWRKPLMTIGRDTFIHDIMQRSGFINVFEFMTRYPIVTEEDIRRAEPECILLSSEPYPFRENHLDQFQKICPRAQVLLADGEMFSWFGSRLMYAPEYLKLLGNRTNKN